MSSGRKFDPVKPSDLHRLTEDRLASLTPAALALLVARAVAFSAIEIVNWTYTQLGGGMGGGVGEQPSIA